MEPQDPPVTDTTPEPGLSLGARLLNVFAAPGELFAHVKTAPASTANWLVPVILAALVGVLYAVIAFAQPAVLQQLRAQQEQKIEALAEKQGWSDAQKEEALQRVESFMGNSAIFKITGSLGAVAGSFGWLFAVALGLWLLGTKLLGGEFGYGKALELAGLSTMIGVLGGILSLFLVVAKGSLQAVPGPALFMGELDPANKVQAFLASINGFTLWYMVVLAIGLAKLSGAAVAKAAAWLFGFWLVFKIVMVLLGWGMPGA